MDFDCGYETPWWYCIKDEPFDITSINAKKRYEINKGKKNFEVKLINPLDYSDEMYAVFISGTSSYTIDIGDKSKDVFVNGLSRGTKTGLMVFGAFYRESGKLCGYTFIRKNNGYINYMTHKVDSDYEKLAINAAIVEGLLSYFEKDIASGIYLSDGERNVYHETRFQDYLEKYFGFRKAYCKLNIKYKSLLGIAVACLYPFRKAIYKIPALKKVSAVLKMHEYYKLCKKDK